MFVSARSASLALCGLLAKMLHMLSRLAEPNQTGEVTSLSYTKLACRIMYANRQGWE
jgi:hypothetical protein